MKKQIITKVGNHSVKLTNLDKIIYPDLGIIKAEIIEFNLEVYKYISPFIKHLPISTIRFPEGISGSSFYNKDLPAWAPEYVHSALIAYNDGDNNYPLILNRATIAWLGNISALEWHPLNINNTKTKKPLFFIVDLDPSKETTWVSVVKHSRLLYEYLRNEGFYPYLKTSGGKGIHIYCPIKPDHNHIKVFSRIEKLMKVYIKDHSEEVTISLSRDRRKGKILLDIYRNHEHQTCIAPYSLRGRKGAPVSTPITYMELEKLTSACHFNINNISERLLNKGDLWSEFYQNASHLLRIKKKVDNEVKEVLQGFIKPMKPETTEAIPSSDKYVFEFKWDGIRCQVHVNNSKVLVYSSSGRDITNKFPEIVANIKSLTFKDAIIDGEMVVMDENGLPSFSRVISRLHGSPYIKNAVFFAFDILKYKGSDLRGSSLIERKLILKNNIIESKNLKFSTHYEDDKLIWEEVLKLGLEGIIAKEKHAIYISGVSRAWLKKKYRLELVVNIIGYVPGKGSRLGSISSLVVAEPMEGMVFRGKVGTGFNAEILARLKKKIFPLEETEKPTYVPQTEDREIIWKEDVLRCLVSYRTLTGSGTFREAVFMQLLDN